MNLTEATHLSFFLMNISIFLKQGMKFVMPFASNPVFTYLTLTLSLLTMCTN
jgi:hypothetical protein